MSMARIGELLTTLLRRTPDGDPLSDAVLLERFARGDQAAFELLVWRHGPMVLAACRRVLRDGHTAEDAFQATFLVLARKAGSVRGAVAGWLHRVALRVCLRMKRRLPPVSLNSDPVAATSPDPVGAAEQSTILDEEVARLPEFLRVPVVVCYLQGHTAEHAAALLGIPRGTVLSRLATARKRLASRLVHRGVGPAVAVLAALSVPELSADAGRTVAETAVAFTLGKSRNTVPAQLALEVLSMTTRRLTAVMAGVMVLVAGLGTGVGFVAAQGHKPTPVPSPAADGKKPTSDKPAADEKARGEKTDKAREQLAKMLAEVEKELADTRGIDLEGMRQRARVLEQRRTEVIGRVLSEQTAVPVELEEEAAKAEERLAAAKVAPVPADVLSEAVKLHPKVAEAQKKVTAKDDELRASKLPKDDAGRKKLEEERAAQVKELLAVKKEVSPEVEAYLRTPRVVEAQKARASVERRLEQFSVRRSLSRQEFESVERELGDLMHKLANLEPMAEELAWKREKRKRLKQELLELDLKELGVGK